MHCLAFFDKVNCTQITDIVWLLSSRRTVNKSLTKPDVITPLGTVFNFQTEIVNGELSCAKLYPVTQGHPVLFVICLQFALTTKDK